ARSWNWPSTTLIRAWRVATPASASTMSQSSPLPTRIISRSASSRLAPACNPDTMRSSLRCSCSPALDVASFIRDSMASGIDLPGLDDAQVGSKLLVREHRQFEEIDFHQLAQVAPHVE